MAPPRIAATGTGNERRSAEIVQASGVAGQMAGQIGATALAEERAAG